MSEVYAKITPTRHGYTVCLVEVPDPPFNWVTMCGSPTWRPTRRWAEHVGARRARREREDRHRAGEAYTLPLPPGGGSDG